MVIMVWILQSVLWIISDTRNFNNHASIMGLNAHWYIATELFFSFWDTPVGVYIKNSAGNNFVSVQTRADTVNGMSKL